MEDYYKTKAVPGEAFVIMDMDGNKPLTDPEFRSYSGFTTNRPHHAWIFKTEEEVNAVVKELMKSRNDVKASYTSLFFYVQKIFITPSK